LRVCRVANGCGRLARLWQVRSAYSVWHDCMVFDRCVVRIVYGTTVWCMVARLYGLWQVRSAYSVWRDCMVYGVRQVYVVRTVYEMTAYGCM
jgi:hypothetical protein